MKKKRLSILHHADAKNKWIRAIEFGRCAASEVILSILSSLIVLCYVSSRFFRQIIQPNVLFVRNHFRENGLRKGFASLWLLIQKKITRVIIRILIFLPAFLFDYPIWESWNRYTMKSKGSIVCLFGICVGFVQALVFTYVDRRDSSHYNGLCNTFNHIALLFFATSGFHILYLMIEILILLILFYSNDHDHDLLQSLSSLSKYHIMIKLGVALLLMIVLHDQVLMEQRERKTIEANTENTFGNDDEIAITENTPLYIPTTGFEEISIDENENGDESISLDYLERYIFELDMHLSLLLLTVIFVLFTIQIPVTLEGLKPMYHTLIGL